MGAPAYTKEQKEKIFQLYARYGTVKKLLENYHEKEVGFPPPGYETIDTWKDKYGWRERAKILDEQSRAVSDKNTAKELARINEVAVGVAKAGMEIFSAQLRPLADRIKAQREAGEKVAITRDDLKEAGLDIGVRGFRDFLEIIRLVYGEPTEITKLVDDRVKQTAVEMGEAVRETIEAFFADRPSVERELFFSELERQLQGRGLATPVGEESRQ